MHSHKTRAGLVAAIAAAERRYRRLERRFNDSQDIDLAASMIAAYAYWRGLETKMAALPSLPAAPIPDETRHSVRIPLI